jgi:hypothetical protein
LSWKKLCRTDWTRSSDVLDPDHPDKPTCTPLAGPNSTIVNLQSQQVSAIDYLSLPSKEPHGLVQLISRFVIPWAKLNTIDRKHNSPLPGRGGRKCRADFPEWGWGWKRDYGTYTMLSCPTLLGEELTCQSQSGGGETQWPVCEIRNIFDQLGESGSELKSEQSYSSIITCSVGRRDKQLPLGQTTSEILSTLDGPSHKGSTGLKLSELTPQKLSDKEGQYPLPQSPAYQPWEGTKVQRKPL